MRISAWIRRLGDRYAQTRRLDRFPVPAADLTILVDSSGRVMFDAQEVTKALRGVAAVLREHPDLGAIGVEQVADKWDMAVLKTLNELADGTGGGRNGEGRA
jgi:hypothetical protein